MKSDIGFPSRGINTMDIGVLNPVIAKKYTSELISDLKKNSSIFRMV